MKLFIKKIFIFIGFVLLTHSLTYITLNYIHNSVDTSNSLFIYGDSQTIQGLDLQELKKRTKLNIYSAAQHGAGIYDFYVFVNKIPNNSKVLLSISKLSQVRPNIYEANTSPLNLGAIYDLYLSNNNYGFKNILIRGIKLPIKKYYKSTYKLHPNNDSITVQQPISIFTNRYSISQKELLLKQDMYLNGVKKLIRKGCEISFIDFPYHPVLKELDDKSNLKIDFENFNERISSLYTNFKTDTIKLPNTINYMYDYSHLNQYGATILTKVLGEKMNQKQITTKYVVH